MADDKMTVSLEPDTQALERALADLADMSDRFGRVLTGSLKSAVVSGKSLEDVLRGVASRMAAIALDIGLKPLEKLAGSFMSNLLGSVMPFANGGVVASPTYFPAGGSLGLMGEAGPEAILPLARGADGRLGVATGGSGAKPVQVVFNMTSPDASSFRKSEAQLSTMLAGAVRRGARRM